MTDDFSSNTSTTGILTAGGSATGNFETTFDQDWFKISLQAGTSYLFKMAGAPDSGGTLYSYRYSSLELLNQNGAEQRLQNIWTSTEAPLKQYTAAVSGTYYLRASTTLMPGSYTLSVTLPAADDYPANLTTGGVIGVGAPAHGVFEQASDIDWFSFHAEAGKHYYILATGAGAPFLPPVTAYDAGGKLVTVVDDTRIFEPASSGDYYLALSATGVGAYNAEVRMMADDYSANNSTPGQLAAGATVSGVMQYVGDIDRFKLDMVAGTVYTIVLKNTGAQAWDHTMSLNLLAPADTGGATSGSITSSDATMSLTVKATVSGTYSVDIHDSPGSTKGSGTYTLSASAAQDDYADTTQAATTLTVGTTMSGQLDTTRDVDVVKLELTAGVTYSFVMPPDLQPEVRVQLFGPDGGVLYAGNRSAESFGYTPNSSGTYYLQVDDWFQKDHNGTTAINLRYSVKAGLADDDYSANAATTAKLTADGILNGTLSIAGGDRDWVPVTMAAGTTYVVGLEGDYRTQLRIVDASGKQLALPEPSNDPYLSKTLLYTAAASGTNYIEVAAAGGDAGSAYKLHTTKFIDDFGNDTSHAGTLVNGNAVNGTLETASDVDVFKIALHADESFSVDFSSPPLSGTADQQANGPTLQIVDSAGKALRPYVSSSDPQGLHMGFLSGAYGDYYVKVVNAGGAPATYTLKTVLGMAGDDISGQREYASALTFGQSVKSQIYSTLFDTDTFKVHLTENGVLTVDLGASDGAVTLNVFAGNTPVPIQAISQSVNADHTVTRYAVSAAGDYYLMLNTPFNKTAPAAYELKATFGSGDITAPLLNTASIVSGATGVGLNPKLTLTFNEAIAAGTGLTLTDDHGVAVTTAGGAALFSASGNALQLDPHLNLRPGTTYTLALPQGSVLDLAGNRYAGHASYSFTTVAPAATGSSGNDLFTGSASGKKIDGGAGIDTVFYDDSKGPLDISLQKGQVTVSQHGASSGDTLTGIERLLFPDHKLALDIDGHGGQAYRLYQAAFNRTPDLGGLGFWINALDKGISQKEVAHNFIISAEFKQQYGDNLSDHDFATNLYKNVLHRAPDPGGLEFWINMLHNGVDRADVLNGFSESAENQAALLPVIGQGFPFIFAG